ncbi:MAG: type IV toxin-antitoxin system AbiEi family antitoxin domain-containing protein [Gammaproteobacteria bacterium]|nr:type IV toxin-antitoxin system AbiEi family antitoxin domain-containing protein [Gammaproteobacteria bacterium]
MANSHLRTKRLKPVLDKVPPGFLVDTAWLRAQGVDPKSIHRYVSRGWLERVIRGVYRRPLPMGIQDSTLVSWESVILSLQRLLGHDVHLGGESALDLAGLNHYLYFGGRPQVHFYGSVPIWVSRLPLRTNIQVHRRTLFGDYRVGIDESDHDVGRNERGVSVWHWPIVASCPERAILEALDVIRTAADFERLDSVFNALTTLRPNLLTMLLASCQSVKVRRLFFVFAEKHSHAWMNYLDKSRIDFGSGPRALVEGGRIHPVYRIYVPPEFVVVESGLTE